MSDSIIMIDANISVNDAPIDVNMSTDNIPLDVEIQENPKYELDYAKLINKPTLNGIEINGAMFEEDPLVPSWAKEPVKPEYTPIEVGAVDERCAIPLDELSLLFQ